MEASSAITQLPPPRGSSIEPPKWLLAAVMLLLAARILLALNHSVLPPSVHYYSADQAREMSKAQDKPILYVVSAHWSVPCKNMENTALSNNKEVAEYINANFIPVLIYDLESKNNKATVDFFKRYEINFLPAFVATTHDGTTIRSSNSYSGAHALRCSLKTFIVDADYTRAKNSLRDGDFTRSQQLFAKYLEDTHWASARSGWASIFDVVTLRMIGDNAGAQQALQRAVKHQRALEYTSKMILDYLNGQCSEETLLSRVYRHEDSIAYHFAIGINAFAMKNFAKAREHLQWVVDNCEKSTTEKQISRSLLLRLDSSQ